MNEDRDQQAARIGKDVAPAAFDHLAGVIPAKPDTFGLYGEEPVKPQLDGLTSKCD